MNSLFRLTTTKTSKLHIAGLLCWIQLFKVDCPLKGPLIQKVWPCYDIIMLHQTVVLNIQLSRNNVRWGHSPVKHSNFGRGMFWTNQDIPFLSFDVLAFGFTRLSTYRWYWWCKFKIILFCWRMSTTIMNMMNMHHFRKLFRMQICT